MKTSSSYTDKNNPRHAVASSTDNAKTLPKKGASTKEGEHHSTSPVDDATGGVKHKGAEERIRFQARLLDAVGHAVIATDPQGKIIYWNRAAQELYGWSEEEVMGRSVLEVTRSEMMLERAEEIRSALMIGRGWSGEFEVRRKDGTSFMAMITDTTVYDEEGYLAAIVSVSTDITERKRAEERLRQAET